MKCKRPSRIATLPPIWAIAAEYFTRFRRYLSSPAMLQTTASAFLRGIMVPDVMVNSLFGVEVLLEDWKLFALCFNGVNLEVKYMKMPTSDSLIADTIIRVKITSNTLHRAFPHLNRDGHGGVKGGVWSPLAVQILGQQFTIHGSVRFGWDNMMDEVVSLHFQADMMTPLLGLLDNLEDASRVFSQARVTPDCRFHRG